jgi:hypothetical protein
MMEVDCLQVQQIISNTQINFHSLILKIISQAIVENPEINATVRMGKIFERLNVRLFFHVLASEVQDDLSGVVFENCHLLNLFDFNQLFLQQIKKIKTNQDQSFHGSKKIFKILPAFFARTLLAIVRWIQYEFNIWLPFFGNPQDAFGSVMVTSVGSLGIDEAYCPMAKYTKIPMVLALGTIKMRPSIIANQVVSRPTMKIGATWDHRIMDGFQFSKLQDRIIYYFNHPEKLP